MTNHPRAILFSGYREGPFPVLLGNPDAAEVEATGGRPHIDITLAEDLAVRTDDVGYIDDLIEVLERGRARLVMWRQDHKQQRKAGA